VWVILTRGIPRHSIQVNLKHDDVYHELQQHYGSDNTKDQKKSLSIIIPEKISNGSNYM
jgi:hypothetical protein